MWAHVFPLLLTIFVFPQLLQSQDDDFSRQPPRQIIRTGYDRSDSDPQQVRFHFLVFLILTIYVVRTRAYYWPCSIMLYRFIYQLPEQITWELHGLLTTDTHRRSWSMERKMGDMIRRQGANIHRTLTSSIAPARFTMSGSDHWSPALRISISVEVQAPSSPSRHLLPHFPLSLPSLVSPDFLIWYIYFLIS